MKPFKHSRSIQEHIIFVTVSEKGQLVIPAEIRRLLGITPATRLKLLPDAGEFRALVDDAKKTKRAADSIRIAGYTGKGGFRGTNGRWQIRDQTIFNQKFEKLAAKAKLKPPVIASDFAA